jgi:hypothetical protein
LAAVALALCEVDATPEKVAEAAVDLADRVRTAAVEKIRG